MSAMIRTEEDYLNLVIADLKSMSAKQAREYDWAGDEAYAFCLLRELFDIYGRICISGKRLGDSVVWRCSEYSEPFDADLNSVGAFNEIGGTPSIAVCKAYIRVTYARNSLPKIPEPETATPYSGSGK